ncbi:hypothetical protein SDJN03_30155, partial [Cucurbita argyrosperma subsp. sororia]
MLSYEMRHLRKGTFEQLSSANNVNRISIRGGANGGRDIEPVVSNSHMNDGQTDNIASDNLSGVSLSSADNTRSSEEIAEYEAESSSINAQNQTHEHVSDQPTEAASQHPMRTRLRNNIVQAKQFTDGTIRYSETSRKFASAWSILMEEFLVTSTRLTLNKLGLKIKQDSNSLVQSSTEQGEASKHQILLTLRFAGISRKLGEDCDPCHFPLLTRGMSTQDNFVDMEVLSCSSVPNNNVLFLRTNCAGKTLNPSFVNLSGLRKREILCGRIKARTRFSQPKVLCRSYGGYVVDGVEGSSVSISESGGESATKVQIPGLPSES